MGEVGTHRNRTFDICSPWALVVGLTMVCSPWLKNGHLGGGGQAAVGGLWSAYRRLGDIFHDTDRVCRDAYCGWLPVVYGKAEAEGRLQSCVRSGTLSCGVFGISDPVILSSCLAYLEYANIREEGEQDVRI